MISRKIFFNSILRGVLEAYLRISISTWLAVQKIDTEISSREELGNVALTLVMIILICGFPPLTFFLLKNN
jgi:hypothetical protein